MAELASGAVNALLGVIRNEQRLLGGVKRDVQFIKEEMESMNSFLLHLARTTPPGGEQDEQVRTWMSQVRLLAQDCNNCIDLYLYRGNPDIHLARKGLRRYVWLVPWLLRRLVAQHRAAVQLRQLKERASDVGKRRLRYGVEVPERASKAKEAAVTSGVTAGADEGGAGAEELHDEQEDYDEVQTMVPAATAGPRTKPFHAPSTLNVYLEEKLLHWIQHQVEDIRQRSIPSIAIVPSADADQDAIGREACTVIHVETPFKRSVWVDIPAVHFKPVPTLRPKDVLFYILRELQCVPEDAEARLQQLLPKRTADQGEWEDPEFEAFWTRFTIYHERRMKFSEIKQQIHELDVPGKINKIKEELSQVEDGAMLELDMIKTKIQNASLGALLFQLHKIADSDAAEQDKARKKKTTMPSLQSWYKKIINEAAKKLQIHIKGAEAGASQSPGLDTSQYASQYARILREVFPNTAQNKSREEAATSNTPVTEDQMKEVINKVKTEILRELLPGTSSRKPLHSQEQDNSEDKKRENGRKENPENKSDGSNDQDQTANATVRETQEMEEINIEFTQKEMEEVRLELTQKQMEEVERIMEKMEEAVPKIIYQLKLEGIVNEIKNLLKKERALVILKIDQRFDGFLLDEVRDFLSNSNGIAGIVVVPPLTNAQWIKQYYYPPEQEPIDYSFVGLYLDTLLKHTRKEIHDEGRTQILRTILAACQPYDFCMKLFAHALHANPKRSNEELRKLQRTLKAVSPKSMHKIAYKVFKFSCNDLPKEYKSCLLYLAIFPKEYTISRSTLIGRWVVEGLITTDDWRWSSSIRKAQECFDVLIGRSLVYPAGLGATGVVKSCIIGEDIHKFITKMAEKQHILEPRLSYHLARHFSIFNDLRLRASEKIEDFLKNLSGPFQFTLLKVLDLEGCHCFEKNKRYLKNICCKIVMLKYLSLRRTDANQLPSEINNLHELEVLDIRQTKVPDDATRNLRLLKLKRLLAGHRDPIPRSTDIDMAITQDFTGSVQIPEKVEKMLEMEILSNVKPVNNQDLQDIGKLLLRKLGVTIEDKGNNLNYLVQAISNLHHTLQSLSITLVEKTRCKGSIRRCFLPDSSNNALPNHIRSFLKESPKALENLSITGQTMEEPLLEILIKDVPELTKVTLSSTLLSQKDLDTLADMEKLLCFRLQNILQSNGEITFKNNGFKNLKYFLFEGAHMTGINFDGAFPVLEEIYLSNAVSNKDIIISGADCRPPEPEEQESSTTTKSTATTTAAVGAHDSPELKQHESNNNTTTTTTGVDGLLNNTNNTSRRNNDTFDSLFHNNSAMNIAKVTLRGTLLNEGNIQKLAEKPNLRCLVLLEKSYIESKLTFNKDKFPKLNLLTVNCPEIIEISFTSGSAPKLEKIVWSFTEEMDVTLSGIENLLKLKELEFNKVDRISEKLQKAIYKHWNNPELKLKGQETS